MDINSEDKNYKQLVQMVKNMYQAEKQLTERQARVAAKNLVKFVKIMLQTEQMKKNE